jgi:hypothetical protein
MLTIQRANQVPSWSEVPGVIIAYAEEAVKELRVGLALAICLQAPSYGQALGYSQAPGRGMTGRY